MNIFVEDLRKVAIKKCNEENYNVNLVSVILLDCVIDYVLGVWCGVHP